MPDPHRDSGRINRRDLIIETATHLFSEQGYTATSVRQIAEVVGCTEAALYYHFKDGKRALLQAVLECEMPKLTSIINSSDSATSFQEAMSSIVAQMTVVGPERMEKMRWILGEFHRLSDEEKALFHDSHLQMHHIISQVIDPMWIAMNTPTNWHGFSLRRVSAMGKFSGISKFKTSPISRCKSSWKP